MDPLAYYLVTPRPKTLWSTYDFTLQSTLTQGMVCIDSKRANLTTNFDQIDVCVASKQAGLTSNLDYIDVCVMSKRADQTF